MSLINGFNCTNCSEELLAKRGIDPSQGATKAALSEQYERDMDTKSTRQREDSPALPLRGVNSPTVGSTVGSQLNLFA